MPTYCYKCTSCEHQFEVRHSMTEACNSCQACGSNKIFKIPSIQDIKKLNTVKKPGKIVDQFIKDTKKEINSEKKRMKREEY